MKIKIGQTWKHPLGYILKVANYDDTSGKWLMKIRGQDYYFYAKPQTILTWQLQKGVDKLDPLWYNKTIK